MGASEDNEIEGVVIYRTVVDLKAAVRSKDDITLKAITDEHGVVELRIWEDEEAGFEIRSEDDGLLNFPKIKLTKELVEKQDGKVLVVRSIVPSIVGEVTMNGKPTEINSGIMLISKSIGHAEERVERIDDGLPSISLPGPPSYFALLKGGVFHFYDVPDGEYEMKLYDSTLEKYVLIDAETLKIKADASKPVRHELKIRERRKYNLEIELRDFKTGKRIHDAVIQVRAQNVQDSGKMLAQRDMNTLFKDLTEDSYRVVAMSQNHLVMSEIVDLGENKTIQLIARPFVDYKLKVLSKEGRPVPGVYLMAAQLKYPGHHIPLGETDEQGIASMTRLVEDSAMVVVKRGKRRSDPVIAYAKFDVKDGQTHTLTTQDTVAWSAKVNLVSKDNNAKRSMWRVRVFDASHPIPVVDTRLSDQGTFEAATIPGKYRIFVETGRSMAEVGTIEIGDDKPAEPFVFDVNLDQADFISEKEFFSIK